MWSAAVVLAFKCLANCGNKLEEMKPMFASMWEPPFLWSPQSVPTTFAYTWATYFGIASASPDRSYGHPVCSHKAMWLRLARSATAPRGQFLPWSASWHPPALTRQCFADGEEKFPKPLHFCPCRSWPVGGWGERRIWMLMLRPGENREGDGLLLHVQVKTINWRKTREQAAHSCCCKLRQFPTGSHWKPAEGKIFSLEVHTAARAGQAKPHVWWLRLGRWRRRRLLRCARGSGVWPQIPAAPSACRLE